MGSNRAGVGYDVKSIIGNRCVAGSIWSRSKSKLKAKAKAKSKSRLKRDETRARSELCRKAKTDIVGREPTSFILQEKSEIGTYRSRNGDSE